MSDLIERQKAIDAISCDITVTGRQNAELVAATIGTFVDRIKALPSVQPWLTMSQANDAAQSANDCISRRAAIAEFSCCELTPDGGIDANYAIDFLLNMPSAQPIDMQEAYYRGKIDGIKECTARLKKVNEEFKNEGSDQQAGGD